MRYLSWVIPYYRNLPMLALHLENLSSVALEVMRHLTIFIVDDCSPADERPDVMIRNANDEVRKRIRLLRVLDDIPWNQHGARNLGAKLAKTDWLLMTDIDRIVPAHDLAILVTRRMNDQRHYKPLQYRMRPLMPLSELTSRAPFNQFVCTRKAYWKAGGYDEDYCGSYGGDGPFLRELSRIAPLERMQDVRMIRYCRHVLEGANTATLDRVAGKALYSARYKDKHARGAITPTRPIRFRWTEVKL
jgi:Glycosyl transferase family 2